MKATLSPTAAKELREAADFIASDNRKAARRFVLTVQDALSTIGEHPDIGAERLELAEPPIRFWTVHRYPTCSSTTAAGHRLACCTSSTGPAICLTF